MAYRKRRRQAGWGRRKRRRQRGWGILGALAAPLASRIMPRIAKVVVPAVAEKAINMIESRSHRR
jgi:hypothetical protein